MPEPKMINVQHISNGFSAYEQTWWGKKYTVVMFTNIRRSFGISMKEKITVMLFLVDSNEIFLKCNALIFVMWL